MSEKRFIIEKNAISYLKNNSLLVPPFLQEGITNKKNFSYTYFGDNDFVKFFHLDIKRLKNFVENYEVEYLLKNINYNNIRENVVSFFNIFCENIKSNKSIYIINTHSLNMAFIGKILESTGQKNVVYSFNKEFYINSNSNSLEGALLLFAIKNSSYLNEFIDEIKRPFLEKLNIINKDSYFYIDENNIINNKLDLIDDYLKTQIGYKKPRSIYRIDKYITKDFVIKNNISNLICFDSDSDFGNNFKLLKSQLEGEKINIENINYKRLNNNPIGIYENYLLEQNKKYLDYKFNILILNKNQELAEKTNRKYYKKELKDKNYTNYKLNSNKYKNEENIKITPLAFIPYGIGIVLLVIFMLLKNSTSLGIGSDFGGYTSGGGYSSYGGSSYNYSNSSSNKSSSTSIRSFGGGGFSKSSG